MNPQAGDGAREMSRIHVLKQEIDDLTAQQLEALRSATFVGMTPVEAQEYDARRAQILGKIEELRRMELAQ